MPLQPRRQVAEAPVWPGAAPPLADGFVTRPESASYLDAALAPGSTVILTSASPAATGPAGPGNWHGACGKTQLAVACAQQLAQSRDVELLVWVCAASRASVLTGYAAAIAAAGADWAGLPGTGTARAGLAEAVAARFISLLADASRPWAVVLDDVRDSADLAGLWPQGSAGTVLVTTSQPAVAAARPDALAVPLGAFSTHEALGYLMGRLSADPDKRLGALDLVTDLGCEPMALAQASAVIASSDLSCREYRSHFTRRRRQVQAPERGPLAAAAVTWTLSVSHASALASGGAIQPLLALIALLDGSAIPGTLLITQAVLDYLAGASDVSAPDPEQVWAWVHSLERAGLVTIDPSTAPPTVRIASVVQHGIRATASQPQLRRAARAAADALLEIWPESDLELPLTWPAASLIAGAARLQQVAGAALVADSGLHPLLLRAGQGLATSSLTGPAVSYWAELTAASSQAHGRSSPVAFTAGSQLAEALVSDGQVAEAVSWARWVLAGRSRVLGAGHPQTGQARIGLSRALTASGQPAEAAAVLAAVVTPERISEPGR